MRLPEKQKEKMNQGLDISFYRKTNKEKVHISEMEPNTQRILEERSTNNCNN